MTLHSLETAPFGVTADTAPPVFVAVQTTSYSGATLLAFLLNAHPEIASIGEMSGLIASEDPETYLCSCGRKIKSCPFWAAVQGAMQARGLPFETAHFDTEMAEAGPPLLRLARAGTFRNRALDGMREALVRSLPGEARRLRQRIARNVALMEAVLEVTGKRVFVDTSKDHLRAPVLARMTALDVRYLHLVRDPRGVIASRLRRGAPLDARQAARQWVRLHERIEWMAQSLAPDKVLRVRYEDVCRSPQATMRRLYAFCGVTRKLDVTDPATAGHHIIGNPMRLDNYAAIRVDERWRERLTAQETRDILDVAGERASRYGYR